MSGVKVSVGTGRKVDGRDQPGRGQKQMGVKGSKMMMNQMHFTFRFAWHLCFLG